MPALGHTEITTLGVAMMWELLGASHEAVAMAAEAGADAHERPLPAPCASNAALNSITTTSRSATTARATVGCASRIGSASVLPHRESLQRSATVVDPEILNRQILVLAVKNADLRMALEEIDAVAVSKLRGRGQEDAGNRA